MDDSVWFDERRGVIVIKAPEYVNREILDEYRERMMALPRFTPYTPVLVDWTRVNQATLPASLVRERALNPWPVSARIAFYAPSDVLYGLARMYAQQSPQTIEAFRDRCEAVEWVSAQA
jgi:hypothetical protein